MSDDLFGFCGVETPTPGSDAEISASIDTAVLVVVECDDGPRVVDKSLGIALGYDRTSHIRQLIERHKRMLLALGTMPHREAQFFVGQGAKRWTKEWLLNQAQVNYLVMRSDMPNADAACVLIAKVFTAWQNGKLGAKDLETAVELQDAAESLSEQSPLLNDIFTAISRVATKHDLKCTEDSLKRKIDELAGRQPPSARTVEIQVRVVWKRYGGLCPCCGDRMIVRDGARLLDNNKQPLSHTDHWFRSSRNGLYEVWLICRECNIALDTEEMPRSTKEPEWSVFQKRVKAAERDTDPLLPMDGAA